MPRSFMWSLGAVCAQSLGLCLWVLPLGGAGCGAPRETVREAPEPEPPPEPLPVESKRGADEEAAGTSHCDGFEVWFRGQCRSLREVDESFGCPAGTELHRFTTVDGFRQRLCRDRHLRRDGLWRSWYERGSLHIQATFDRGRLDGRYVQWDRDARRRTVSHWKEGHLDGKQTWWHDNRQKWAEGDYRDGRRHGLWRTWDSSGYLKSATCYDDGRVVWDGTTDWDKRRCAGRVTEDDR